MKPSVLILTLTALTIVASGCSGPTQPAAVGATVQRPTTGADNTAPRVNAGLDMWVPSPGNFVMLEGFADDAERNIERFLWTKVSGPPSYSIESPELRRTRVVALEQGTYEFEFAVTDKGGLTSRDTVKVHVYTPSIPGANELIFGDLRWMCPMGCSVAIENLGSHVPPGAAFKVLLKRPDAGVWFEVKAVAHFLPGDRYVYGIGNDRLWIYSDDENQGTAVDVKIVF
jgi:hypothetical protein